MEFVLGVLVAVVAGGIAFAIVVLATGSDPGLVPRDRDRLPVTLPTDRPLTEPDVTGTRFDTGLRGYRTTQVDSAFARVAYDIGFKDELIRVLASEVSALRDGRTQDADTFRSIRRRAGHGHINGDKHDEGSAQGQPQTSAQEPDDEAAVTADSGEDTASDDDPDDTGSAEASADDADEARTDTKPSETGKE